MFYIDENYTLYTMKKIHPSGRPKTKILMEWSLIKPLNQEPRSKIFIFWTFWTACLISFNLSGMNYA